MTQNMTKPNNLNNINALSVRLNNQPIGIINHLAGDRHLFSFEQDYIDNPDRPTLSLSFKGQMNQLITSSRIYNVKLPPFFSNLLPEGHMRDYLAKRADVKPEREFFLLATLGADLPGGLIVTPLEFNQPTDPLIFFPSNKTKNAPLRFSLAGIQLKFSAIMASSGGLTIPADGMNGSWIVKLPSLRFPHVPENEFVMLSLAREIGIEVPNIRLIDINEIGGLPNDVTSIKGAALAIERFDRDKNKRIHMEDFAQIFGLYPNNKYSKRSYANIAAVLWAETGETGTYDFVRRLVFSILIGNADMHLKNWSVLYPDGRTPRLSPAYDFVSTIPYLPNDELALSFGESKNIDKITPDQIKRFTNAARLPSHPILKLVKETIEQTIVAWRKFDEKELLPNEIKKTIAQQIQTVASNTIIP